VSPNITFQFFFKKIKEEKTLKNNTSEVFDVDLSVINQKQKLRLPIQPGITIIVGSRGSGKTFLLNEIKKQLEEKAIRVDSFGMAEISSFENRDSFTKFRENIIENELNNQENSQLKVDNEVNEIIQSLKEIDAINYSEVQQNFNKLLSYEKDRDKPNYTNITSYTIRNLSSELDDLEKEKNRWKGILNGLDQQQKAIKELSFIGSDLKKTFEDAISLIKNNFHKHVLKQQKET